MLLIIGYCFACMPCVPLKRYYDNYGGLLCFFSLNVISATLSGKFGCSFVGVKQIYYGTEFNELEK